MTPRALRAWFFALAWGALIWGVSSLPLHGHVFETAAKKHLDWMVHAVEYCIFAWLFVRALLETVGVPAARRAFLLTAFTISLFAVADEIHQSDIPYRSCNVADSWADMAGVVFALAVKKRNLSVQNA